MKGSFGVCCCVAGVCDLVVLWRDESQVGVIWMQIETKIEYRDAKRKGEPEYVSEETGSGKGLATSATHETCDGDTRYGSCTADQRHTDVTLCIRQRRKQYNWDCQHVDL